MYPDAHDASDNLGKSVEAVYNKATGRWEFPGDVRSCGDLCTACTVVTCVLHVLW